MGITRQVNGYLQEDIKTFMHNNKIATHEEFYFKGYESYIFHIHNFDINAIDNIYELWVTQESNGKMCTIETPPLLLCTTSEVIKKEKIQTEPKNDIQENTLSTPLTPFEYILAYYNVNEGEKFRIKDGLYNPYTFEKGYLKDRAMDKVCDSQFYRELLLGNLTIKKLPSKIEDRIQELQKILTKTSKELVELTRSIEKYQ